jgi:hypothetical protein
MAGPALLRGHLSLSWDHAIVQRETRITRPEARDPEHFPGRHTLIQGMTTNAPGRYSWPSELHHSLPLFADNAIGLDCAEVQNRRNPKRKKSLPHTLRLDPESVKVFNAIIGEDEIDQRDAATGLQNPRHFA